MASIPSIMILFSLHIEASIALNGAYNEMHETYDPISLYRLMFVAKATDLDAPPPHVVKLGSPSWINCSSIL